MDQRNTFIAIISAPALALTLMSSGCDSDDTPATSTEDTGPDEELINPFGVKDHDAVERGKELYLDHCAGCHNFDGSGSGPDSDGFEVKPQDLVDDKAGKRSDGWFFNNIWDGVEDSEMEAFSGTLDSDEECWQIVTYLRTLQQ